MLHNYLRNNQILESNVDDDIEEMSENQLLPCTHTNSGSASCAFVVRQKFTEYFNIAGSALASRERFEREILSIS